MPLYKINKLHRIITGLQIFAKHGGSETYAEHDEFIASPAEGTVLPPEDVAALIEAGWHRYEGGDSNYWAIYT